VRLAGTKGVQVFDLNEAAKRRFEPWLVRLGPQDEEAAPPQSGQLMIASPDSGEMMVGHPRLRAVFGLMEMSGMIATAMNSFSVAGHDIVYLSKIERKLNKTGIGRYAATFMTNRPGPYEVVLTSTGFASCEAFTVASEGETLLPQRMITSGDLELPDTTNSNYRLTLNLTDENNVPIPIQSPHVTIVNTTSMKMSQLWPSLVGKDWQVVLNAPEKGDYIAILADAAWAEEIEQNAPLHFRVP
jgi:hypothetical protein